MAQVNSEKDIKQVFQQALARNLPEVFKNLSPIIQEGVIQSVNVNSFTASVTVSTTGQTINSVRFSKNLAGSIFAGQVCLLITPDPKSPAKIFLIGVF